MKAIVDTNVLIRMFTQDHPTQSPAAAEFLSGNEIVVTSQTLCELVWVLKRVYNFSSEELETAIRFLAETDTVTVDNGAVREGLSFVTAGGDFADGVIAFEGRRLGGQFFATFDRKAASILGRQGIKCLLLRD